MNKFLNPKNYANRIISLANRHFLNRLERLIAPDPALPLRHPPVFFLGAPRSGSTLMIQAITDALDVGYISNSHCRWYGAPFLAERLCHPALNKPLSDFSSLHGDTKGSYAPAECGEWWYRFFRRQPSYVTLQEVNPGKMHRFRQSIAALTNAFDRPILFKNLYASLRIQAIAHYIPESLFIVTYRNEVENGHSLLETRKSVFNDYDAWWSMEPPEIERLKILPAYQQVIEQIRHIHRVIDLDLKNSGVPDSRVLNLNYGEFCENPNAETDAVRKFLSSNGCEVKRIATVPSSFKRREEIRIDKLLYDELVRYAQGV